MKKLLLALTILSFTLILPASGQNRKDAHGLRQGQWTGTYSNGALRYKGTFKNGKPVGTFFYYYPTGLLKAKMRYADNGHIARVITYHLNGKPLAQGKFIDKKKDSTWRYYSDTDGKLVLEETFTKGIKNGPTIVYYGNTGKPSELTEYKNGRKNGRWVTYFPDGKISTEGFYVNDTLQGPYKAYDINGKLLIKGQYEHALQEGLWMIYDTTGKLQRKEFFHNGLQVKKKKAKTPHAK